MLGNLTPNLPLAAVGVFLLRKLPKQKVVKFYHVVIFDYSIFFPSFSSFRRFL